MTPTKDEPRSFLYVAAQGGGDWSLDALIRRKRESLTAN
jgi:hypothetical protein